MSWTPFPSEFKHQAAPTAEMPSSQSLVPLLTCDNNANIMNISPAGLAILSANSKHVVFFNTSSQPTSAAPTLWMSHKVEDGPIDGEASKLACLHLAYNPDDAQKQLPAIKRLLRCALVGASVVISSCGLKADLGSNVAAEHLGLLAEALCDLNPSMQQGTPMHLVALVPSRLHAAAEGKVVDTARLSNESDALEQRQLALLPEPLMQLLLSKADMSVAVLPMGPFCTASGGPALAPQLSLSPGGAKAADHVPSPGGSGPIVVRPLLDQALARITRKVGAQAQATLAPSLLLRAFVKRSNSGLGCTYYECKADAEVMRVEDAADDALNGYRRR